MTRDITLPDIWGRRDELLSRSWKHASNYPMAVQATCVDAGFSSGEVLRWTARRHSRRIFGVKGLSAAFGKPIWPRRASYDKNKWPLYAVSTDEAKLFTAARLRIAEPGP